MGGLLIAAGAAALGGEDGCQCEPPAPALAIGEDHVWVTAEGAVERFDRMSGRSAGRVVLPVRAPRRIAEGAGAVWVTGPKGLWRVDTRRMTARLALRMRGGGWAVTVAFGAVWVVNDRGDRLIRFNPRSGRAEARIPVPQETRSVAAAARGLWVAGVGPLDAVSRPAGRGALGRINARGNVAFGRLTPLGREPVSLTVSRGVVWVANLRDSTVARIDARTGRPLGAPTRVPPRPISIVADGRAVWVVSDRGWITAFDPVSAKVVGAPIGIGGHPYAAAMRGGELWVTWSDGPPVRRVLSSGRG
jgi:streptogramin lyase